jgi:FXSXX-COOH protein
MIMKAAESQAPEFAAVLADLGKTPLTEIAESEAGTDVLARILTEQSSLHVPVAAFQSSV